MERRIRLPWGMRVWVLLAALVTVIVLLTLRGGERELLQVSEPRAPLAGETLPASPEGSPAVAEPARAGVRLPSQWHPFSPTRLQLRPASGGPTAPVDRVDTRAGGELALPDDPDRVGWWAGGARAGDPFGSVVLAGHVDSREFGIGFLAQMSDLEVGDVVRVADGRRHLDYRVHTSRLVDADEIGDQADLFASRGASRLVLITCGGPYDRAGGGYTHNLVVEASPLT